MAKKKRRMNHVLILLVFLAAATVNGQNGNKHRVEGKLGFCYLPEQDQKQYNYYDVTVKATGLEGQGLYYPKRVDDRATVFRFEQLPAGKYAVVVSCLGSAKDTVIELKGDITGMDFCLDNAYRPVENTLLAEYQEKAKADIGAGEAKIISLVAGSISRSRKRERQNRQLKSKYGFTHELYSCYNVTDLRADFVYRRQIAAYNQTVMAYLDEKFGGRWRRNLNLDAEAFSGM